MSDRSRHTRIALFLGAGAVALTVHAGCTDPVRDDEIAALGPEAPGVAPGPNHRPGQPCLHCHSNGGPADAHPFALAGTVFRTAAFDSEGAPDISVQFVDARGGKPRTIPVTNDVGNFWVPLAAWPDLSFPVRVGLYSDPDEAPTQTMRSLVNREGSCNYCHRRAADPSSLTEQDTENNKRFVGQIYAEAG